MGNGLDRARWIWLPLPEQINQYGDFRQAFTLPETVGSVRLHISADSRYAAFINGGELLASQFADYPAYKAYDTMDITALVHPGENVLAVLGYCQGEDSSVYRLGTPGVIFAVEADGAVVAASGGGTLCRLSREYESGEVERFSGQLSFSFRYHASARDGWQAADYRPGPDWGPGRETGACPVLVPRPNRPLVRRPPCPGRLTAQGVFTDPLSPAAPCGERMQRAALAYRAPGDWGLPETPASLPVEKGLRLADPAGDGLYLLVDLQREEAGLLHLDIALPEPARILIGFGEHLDDLRARTSVGGRQFAAVYEARAGRQTFTHALKRAGCRYVQLHIYAHAATLYYAGVCPTVYPVDYRPAFHCADALHNRIFEVSRRTLELCMHEHYEDCPWREQALYAMDSRNQMLCGYYVFQNKEFAASSLRLLALGQREDGLLELCAPARVGVTIPCFSLSFVTALCEHVEAGGDLAFGRELLPVAERILSLFLGRRGENGLVPCFTAPGLWNFYEWRDGLDGGSIFREDQIPETYDAPLNAMLSLALNDAAGLYARLGDTDAAVRCQREGNALNRAMAAFWEEERGAYATYLTDTGRRHFCELTQALLVCAGATDGARLDRALEALSSAQNGLVPVTLSCSIFKYEALMRRPEAYGRWVMEDVARIWGGMLFAGATSFWETDAGAWDFERAGSLCHGWSAVPIYLYYRYVLGRRLDGETEPPVFCGLYAAAEREEADARP